MADIAWIPVGEAEKVAVLEQMERIAVHPAFKSSTHSVKFLRYVVESALRGDGDRIKERTIGIEVFGREPDYDVTQDRIVRATAAEVRKRIAQYYYEPEHAREIRFDFRPGSYLPEFHPPLESSTSLVEQAPANLTVPATASVSENHPWRFRATVLCVVLAILACLIVALRIRKAGLNLSAFRSSKAVSSLDLFWKPILDSSGNLLICVDGDPDIKLHRQTDSIPLTNAFSLVRLGDYLGKRGKSYQLRTISSLDFQDLAAQSNVLIGGLSNPWAVDQTAKLRYHLEQHPGTGLIWIEDRKNPSSRIWSTNAPLLALQSKDEYAIVVRTVTAGNPGIIIAGLTPNGTAGASECLLSVKCIDDIVRQAPKDWVSKSIEAVVVTHMIDGRPGPSSVQAVEAWKP